MTMHKLLFSIFSTVCGENPEHLWMPGGEVLPCCQRCTGLYAGALVAVGLHLWLMTRASERWFLIHAIFLILLGCFIFPWMPQSPALRTVSGTLFGFGVVAFLWPAVSFWCSRFKVCRFATGAYVLGLAICLGIIPVIAESDGVLGAFILLVLLLAGIVALTALACANVAFCVVVGSRWWHEMKSPTVVLRDTTDLPPSHSKLI